MAAIAGAAAVLGFLGGWAYQASGLGRASTEQLVRGYILENPEILPEAVERLQQKETLARLEPLRGAVETAFAGAVLGNPEGSTVLVEFTDYACPYCRLSLPDLNYLIDKYSDLKVVVRENPVLSPESVEAARMALAAAAQGKFEAFHNAMFAKDRPSQATIVAAAQEAGLDLARAQAEIATGKYDAELENNIRLSQSLGLTGTPTWVIGDQAFSGAVGRERLEEAILAAEDS